MKLKKHIENYLKNIIQILIKSRDAADKFKEIKEAYEVLSDEQKRAQYDQFGHTDPNQGFGGGRILAALVALKIFSIRFLAVAARDEIQMHQDKVQIFNIR